MAVTEALRLQVAGAPQQDVSKGIVRLSPVQLHALGMEIRLMVTATVPKGVVRFSEATQIELAPEYQESADIAGVYMKAGLYALRANLEAQHVTMGHFSRAAKEATPSVTAEDGAEYEKLARQVKQEAVRIGFGRHDS
jgi:SpoVK/Ycf46/Vps4 family AAA+-type ATPase